MGKTVLVTGATGYIGRHVVSVFLDHGYTVVGSTRDANRLPDLKAAIAPSLGDRSRIEELRLVELDLTDDAGWDSAMDGVDALIHVASPFPLSEPDDREELIRPAVDGATRALEAAARAGVKDVVLTSSIVAVSEDGGGEGTYDETNWSDPDAKGVGAYPASKTLAERKAWDLAKTLGLQLATINPGLVLGPALGREYGSSLQIIERLLKGRDPMLPRLKFPVCHVRDVALAHLRALENPNAAGHRHIIVSDMMTFQQLATAVKEAVPSAKVPTRIAPDLLMKGLALFDPSIKGILPSLGRDYRLSNSRMREALEIAPKDATASVRETALWLKGEGLV